MEPENVVPDLHTHLIAPSESASAANIELALRGAYTTPASSSMMGDALNSPGAGRPRRFHSPVPSF